jgi:pimeloyl-ACP methyl ester carboxylesterase
MGVLEPLQTAYTLPGQVEEIEELITREGDDPFIIVGWSWGAWLGYILAASRPDIVSKLIMVGAAPFEQKYVGRMNETRMSRLSGEELRSLASIVPSKRDPPNPSDDLRRMARIIKRADSYDLIPHRNPDIIYDAEIHRSAWRDGESMRRSGKLLSLGMEIECPVVAVHGDHDPHPAEGVAEPLSGIIDDFRLITLERCGHYPWYEKHARDRFFSLLEELIRNSP